MTRRYEMVYIFDSALDESTIDSTLTRHHDLLKSPDNGEPVKNVNHWGKRTLAYPINNAQVGHYVIVDFHADASVLPEFERSIKLDESIIRHMLILNEGEEARAVPIPEDGDDDGDGPRRNRGRAGSSDGPAKASAPSAPAAASPAESKPAAPETPSEEKAS